MNNLKEINQNIGKQDFPAQRLTSSSLVLNVETMTAVSNFAHVMAGGVATVPKHLQGNVSDCMAICLQAMQWSMNPFAVAQKTHLINGTLGYEAQLVNAVVSSSKAIVGRFKYEYGGDWSVQGNGVGVVEKQAKGENINKGSQMSGSAWVRVGAVLAGETEITWGEPLYPAMQKVKNSPLWLTNPKQQASYLAVKHWARLYTPDVLLGVYTPDEFDQVEREVNPMPKPEVSAFSSLKGGKRKKAKAEVIDADTGEIEPAIETDELGVKYESMHMAIYDCGTYEELKEVAEVIATSEEITDSGKKNLRELFNRRRKELIDAIGGDENNLS